MSNDTESTDGKRQWELLLGCMPALHSYVRRAMGSRDAANDVVQEVSIRVLTGDGPREPERFLAWSRGIARHVIALDWRMRRRALAELPLEDELMETQSCSVWDAEQHIDARASLARAMVDIDSEGLELLVRRYVFEESGRELADELAQSPAAVRMRLMRLRSTLSAGFLPRTPRAVRRAGKSKGTGASRKERAGGEVAALATPAPRLHAHDAAAINCTPAPPAPRRRRSPAPTVSSPAPVFHLDHSRTASTHTG